jgi:RNA polymerase sigma-70 factor, ECF subfamily
MKESETVPMDLPDTASPNRLLVRVADGDEGAFEGLYDAVAPLVYGIAKRVLVDAALAEETAQEVLVEVWQTAARYDPARGSAQSWIATMAHRRAVDRVRASQASRNRDLREGIRGYQESQDDVEDLALAHAEGTRAHEALRELPQAQRQAIALAYYDGLTQNEVSQRLGVPLGTVKTRIRDGMSKLRNRMGVA